MCRLPHMSSDPFCRDRPCANEVVQESLWSFLLVSYPAATPSFSRLLPGRDHRPDHRPGRNRQVSPPLSYPAAINVLQQAAAAERLPCRDDRSAARSCGGLGRSGQGGWLLRATAVTVSRRRETGTNRGVVARRPAYPAVRREMGKQKNDTARTPLRAPVADRAWSVNSVGESGVSHKSARAGLRSADRNNKATLPLTRPGESVQSYAKDLSPPMVKLQFAGWSPGIPPGPRCRPAEVRGPKAYSYPTTMCGGGIPAFWHGF